MLVQPFLSTPQLNLNTTIVVKTQVNIHITYHNLIGFDMKMTMYIYHISRGPSTEKLIFALLSKSQLIVNLK